LCNGDRQTCRQRARSGKDVTEMILVGSPERNAEFLDLLEGIKSLMEAKAISYTSNVAVISVFGPHFREKPSISGLILNALGILGINILAISTSISSCSCLIRADQVEDATMARLTYCSLSHSSFGSTLGTEIIVCVQGDTTLGAVYCSAGRRTARASSFALELARRHFGLGFFDCARALLPRKKSQD
jgi:hypothetical protein